MSKIIKITDETFMEFVTKNKVALVDFWARWCPPCRMLTPIIEELAKDFEGKIAFGKIDVDENKVAPAKLGVSGIPALFIFKNGRHVKTLVGLQSKEILDHELLKVLQ